MNIIFRSLPCVLLPLLLAACATPSNPALPDGRHRIPVNVQARIDQFNQQLARDAAIPRDRAGAGSEEATSPAKLSDVEPCTDVRPEQP